MDDEVDIAELIDDGYGYEEITEAMLDAGYDADDIAEAWVETGYDWEDALEDAIRDQQIDLDDAEYYADMLDMDTSDVYDLYYGYED